jgi:hypothetical protein
MEFDLVGDIENVETIATGRGIRNRIRLRNGRVRLVELHWYEVHGIGKKELKRKRYLNQAKSASCA